MWCAPSTWYSMHLSSSCLFLWHGCHKKCRWEIADSIMVTTIVLFKVKLWWVHWLIKRGHGLKSWKLPSKHVIGKLILITSVNVWFVKKCYLCKILHMWNILPSLSKPPFYMISKWIHSTVLDVLNLSLFFFFLTLSQIHQNPWGLRKLNILVFTIYTRILNGLNYELKAHRSAKN